jgi:hypothetical protein
MTVPGPRYIVERRHGWLLWRSWQAVLRTGDAEEAYDMAARARAALRQPVRIRQVIHGVSIVLREMRT